MMIDMRKSVSAILVICTLLSAVASVGILSSAETISAYSPKKGQDAELSFSEVDITAYLEGGENVTVERSYEDKENVLITDDKSKVTWSFTIPEEGSYQMQVEYIPVEGKGNAIEREILINGELPFRECAGVIFHRTFTDASEPATDSYGNEYRPEQKEVRMWLTETVRDNMGYYSEPFSFALNEGENTLTFNSVSEPMAISRITFVEAKKTLSYAEVLAAYEAEGYEKSGETVTFQGEDAKYKSDPSLYPINDRSSYANVPQSVSRTLINAIGGYNWRNPRQKLTWSVDVPKSGLYRFEMRCKQNFSDDVISNRTMYIDGTIPFEEAKYIEVPYSNSWQNTVFGAEEPYWFYLSRGTHTITLENTTGRITDILRQIQDSVSALTRLAQRIRMVVGLFPDENRDYRLEKQIPELESVLEEQTALLKKYADELQIISGEEKNSAYGLIQKLYIQTDSFIFDSGTIPERLSSFETNVSAVANYILLASSQPLIVDHLSFNGTDIPSGTKESFFQAAKYEILLFLDSFLSDYDALNSGSTEEKSIELWLGGGRDQAMVIKSLIENDFTRSSGISVKLRLIMNNVMVPTNNVLLPAVAAGKGPDISLGQEKSMPVNYGIRNAIYELDRFPDLEEVLERFDESAYMAYQLEGKTYALPETANFLMMYYRKDILQELGIDVPQTWDELYSDLSVLHKNYCDIGLPNLYGATESGMTDSIEQYLMFLYQSGSGFYEEDMSKTVVYSEIGQQAFRKWADLYTKYKITKRTDALSRFRSGYIPIVIAPITFYNKLIVSAPELKGLWEISPVIGTKKDDGTIDRSQVSIGTASVIFRNTDDPESSWEFLKWWTSASAQAAYSREIEVLLGPSGRVPSANLEAFSRISWPQTVLESINEQREHVKGMPEVPGSYIINRYLSTAIRYAVETGGDPAEILFDYDRKINDEITRRRNEFGLD